jgi:hypothetical protein
VGELPDDLTLAACRHGGITELGDAELTEQGVMLDWPDEGLAVLKDLFLSEEIAIAKGSDWLGRFMRASILVKAAYREGDACFSSGKLDCCPGRE